MGRPVARIPAWVSNLALITTLALATAAGAASAEFVRVKVPTANIRSGPGVQYERLWSTYENYPLRVVGKRGRWLQTLDFEGYEGWIYAPLTDTQPTVVVRVERANVRSGPGRDSRLLSTEFMGVAFRVLSRRGDWLRVEHADGVRGWIYRALVWGNW